MATMAALLPLAVVIAFTLTRALTFTLTLTSTITMTINSAIGNLLVGNMSISRNKANAVLKTTKMPQSLHNPGSLGYRKPQILHP